MGMDQADRRTQIRERFWKRAEDVRNGLDEARAVSNGARRDLGELVADVQKATREDPELGYSLSGLSAQVGVSRPTLYKAAEDLASLPGRSSATLAEFALEHYADARKELHARYPHLGGLYSAIEALHVDGFSRKEQPHREARAILTRQYRAALKGLVTERDEPGEDTPILGIR